MTSPFHRLQADPLRPLDLNPGSPPQYFMTASGSFVAAFNPPCMGVLPTVSSRCMKGGRSLLAPPLSDEETLTRLVETPYHKLAGPSRNVHKTIKGPYLN